VGLEVESPMTYVIAEPCIHVKDMAHIASHIVNR
jgi:hypothetical protein